MAKYVESLSERDARLERENVRARERNAQTRERRAQEREIKKEAEEAILKINGSSSAGGNQKGGIYDLSTDNYSQPERNQTNQDVSTEEAGIDTLGGSSDSDLGPSFNAIVCVNGTPVSYTHLTLPTIYSV